MLDKSRRLNIINEFEPPLLIQQRVTEFSLWKAFDFRSWESSTQTCGMEICYGIWQWNRRIISIVKYCLVETLPSVYRWLFIYFQVQVNRRSFSTQTRLYKHLANIIKLFAHKAAEYRVTAYVIFFLDSPSATIVFSLVLWLSSKALAAISL